MQWEWRCSSIGAMDAFLAKHADAIRGVLSCFDRVLFRGSLPLMSGDAMADFLKRKQVKRRTLKTFLLTQAERVKQQALSLAAAAKRPHHYLSGPTRKADFARQIAERDGIPDRLVCVFSVLEPCWLYGRRSASACSCTAISSTGTSV